MLAVGRQKLPSREPRRSSPTEGRRHTGKSFGLSRVEGWDGKRP